MLQIGLARLRQGRRTIAYPAEAPALPDRFRGLPVVDSSKCPDGCRQCADACPTNAITTGDGKVRLDLGRCLFCTDCLEACPMHGPARSPIRQPMAPCSAATLGLMPRQEWP